MAGNGVSVPLTWTVTNNSSADAVNAWADTVYLSSSQTLNLSNSSTYWELGTFNEPINVDGDVAAYLNAGASYTNAQQVTIPNVNAAGTYYFVVVADSNYYYSAGYSFNGQPVTSTANATATATVGVTLPNVTLTVKSATPNPATVVAGNTLSLSWTVQNQGTSTAGGYWYDYVYLSSKQTLDKTATYLGSYYYNGSQNPLAPNATYTGTQTLTIPGATPAGTEYLLIEPDEGTTQAAGASVFAQSITVTIPAVKLATAITQSPSTITPGQSITVAWTVTNNGTTATNASYWYDYIYLSPKTDLRFLGDFPPLVCCH